MSNTCALYMYEKKMETFALGMIQVTKIVMILRFCFLIAEDR